MPDTTLVLEIDGEKVAPEDLTPLVEIQVEEATDVADAATLVCRVEPTADGEWTSMLDPLVTPRTPVVVELTRGDATYRFDGRSAQADWQLDAAGASQLTIKALDRSVEMDAEEKVVAWPGSSDSTAATAVFASYGLLTQVEDTPDRPDPDVHVLFQRCTDWAFVRALAAKWGYAAYLESDGDAVVGHFHPVDPLADPQGELALGFGGDASAVSIIADLTAGQKVEAQRVPTLSDTAQRGRSTGDDEAQGSTSLAGRSTMLLAPDDVLGEVEPQAAADGLARRAAFAMTLTAAIDPARSGLLVRARRTVLVKGLGSQLSGRYLVQRVRHHVTLGAHRQSVTLVRNALGLTGDEPFGDGDLLGDLL